MFTDLINPVLINYKLSLPETISFLNIKDSGETFVFVCFYCPDDINKTTKILIYNDVIYTKIKFDDIV